MLNRHSSSYFCCSYIELNSIARIGPTSYKFVNILFTKIKGSAILSFFISIKDRKGYFKTMKENHEFNIYYQF